MTRKVFYSFHYEEDNWRASMVRNMGLLEGNIIAGQNEWEKITKGGDKSIERWIDGQLENRTCTIVLVGSHTANRKWIKYEIKESWNKGMGVLGIYIHGLEDKNGKQSIKGDNPFDFFTLCGVQLSSIIKVYDPPYKESKNVYNNINCNIKDWIEEAINIRRLYKYWFF